MTEFQQLRLSLSINIVVSQSHLQDLKFDSGNGYTCFVAPANSFGSMGKGYDLALARFMSSSSYRQSEARLKARIASHSHGYLPTTSPCVVDMLDKHSDAWKQCKGRYVMAVPTMVKPQRLDFLSRSEAMKFVFDSTWNISACLNSQDAVSTLVMTGLGSGYGGLDLELVSKSMIYSIVIFHLLDALALEKSLYVMRFFRFEPEMIQELGFAGEEVHDDDLKRVVYGDLWDFEKDGFLKLLL